MGHEEDAGGVFCEKSTDGEKMIDKLNSKCNSLSGFHMVDDFQSTKRDYSEEIRYKRFVPEKGGSGVVCLKVQPTGKCYTDGYLSVSSIGGGTQLTGANTGLRETTTTDDSASDDDAAADDDDAVPDASDDDDDAADDDAADDDDGATEETPVPTPSASIVLTHKHPAAGKSQNASGCVNNKTLEECRDICYNDPEECTHVWFTDNGRCCPKYGVDLTGARSAPGGDFYEIIEGFSNQLTLLEDFKLLLPLLLFILIIMCFKK